MKDLSSRAERAVRRALWVRQTLDKVGLSWDLASLEEIDAALVAAGGDGAGIRRTSWDHAPRITSDFTPAEVAALTAGELGSVPGCGEVTFKEVQQWLWHRDLRLASDGGRPDGVTGNVYADWLEDNGEPIAASKLRRAFPIDRGERPATELGEEGG